MYANKMDSRTILILIPVKTSLAWAFRIKINKPTNTYIANVRERCWKKLFILANKLTTKGANF